MVKCIKANTIYRKGDYVMANSEFRLDYTKLVESYFRMAVRHKSVNSSQVAQRWYKLTNRWLNQLPEEDSKFIRFVFDKRFFRTSDGLYNYKSNDDMTAKRIHLAELEKDFARKSGLIY